MKTHDREILIYYNPESSSDRQTVAHAKGLAKHIKVYAFHQAPSTGTSWQRILQTITDDPKELLNKSHPYYQAHIRGREFNGADWVNIIMNNPFLLKGPIALRGSKAILVTTPTDIYRLVNRATH